MALHFSLSLRSVATVLVAALLLAAFATDQAAAQTTVDQDHRGWVKNEQGLISHNPSNHNYICGDYNGWYRNFMVFDLASISDPVGSVELRMTNPSYIGTPNYRVYEVNEPPATFLAGVTSVAVWDDLGSGLMLGEMPSNMYVNNPVEFDLDMAGVVWINDRLGEELVIGGVSDDPGSRLFRSTNSASHLTQLVLTTNQAPDLQPGTSALTDIDEDPVVNDGDEVEDLLAGVSSDPDGHDLGMAILSADQSNGQWEFSTDGGANWQPIGSVSQSDARLIADDGHVRFVPDANWYGTASFEFRAWDQVQGQNGDTFDTSNNGGAYAFSADIRSAEIEVLPVNDPPEHTFPASVQGYENKPLFFTGANAISVYDVDIYNNDLEMRLTADSGTLLLPEAHAGLIAGGANESATLTMLGHIDDVNDALAELSWRPESGFTGSTQLELHSDDGGATGQGGPQTATDVLTLEIDPAPAIELWHKETPIPHEASVAPEQLEHNHVLTLTVRNSGSLPLTLDPEPVSAGAVEGLFVEILEQPPETTLEQGAETSFVVRLQAENLKLEAMTAQLFVASDDPVYAPFEFTIRTTAETFGANSLSVGDRGCALNPARTAAPWGLVALLVMFALLRRRSWDVRVSAVARQPA